MTHRAVAKEAQVPAGSVTYHFTTLDELLVAALTAAAQAYAQQLQEITDAGHDEIDGLARLIADAGGPGRKRALAERELTLMAARRPALRPMARHWREMVAEVARSHTDDATMIEIAVAAADGICARVLLDDEPMDIDRIAAVLRRSLGVDA